MINKLVQGITKARQEQRKSELFRKLMRHEAEIGGQLFGEVPSNVRREFFCLDKYTWVWHEEWVDDRGKRQVRTTRYDVRPDRILKSQNGSYSSVTPEEAIRLRDAAQLYARRVKSEVYARV